MPTKVGSGICPKCGVWLDDHTWPKNGGLVCPPRKGKK